MEKSWRTMAIIGWAATFILFVWVISIYQGGSYELPQHVGFSWKANFISDLGRTVSDNGRVQPEIRALFIIAMLAVGFTLTAFALSFSSFMRSLWQKWSFIILGATSAIFFFATAILASNIYNTLHRLVMLFGYIALSLMWLIYCLRQNFNSKFLAWTAWIALLILWGYLAFILIAPRPESSVEFSLIHAQVQKSVVIVFFLVFGRHLLTLRNPSVEN